jgi:hypothetical protein
MSGVGLLPLADAQATNAGETTCDLGSCLVDAITQAKPLDSDYYDIVANAVPTQYWTIFYCVLLTCLGLAGLVFFALRRFLSRIEDRCVLDVQRKFDAKLLDIEARYLRVADHIAAYELRQTGGTVPTPWHFATVPSPPHILDQGRTVRPWVDPGMDGPAEVRAKQEARLHARQESMHAMISPVVMG